jgi:hypothetical protein
MMKPLVLLLSTTLFMAIGLALGVATRGPSPWALVQLTSGAAGGFGIAWAGLDVVERWRSLRRSDAS